MKTKPLDKYLKSINRNPSLVSVFLLTYKRPQYVKIMIESILNQTFSNFVLIVLDNCSNDETSEVVNSFLDSRIIYYEHSGYNYKYAFDINKSEYFCVLHDDDVLENSFLDEMYHCMDNNKNLCALSCAANKIDSNGNFIEVLEDSKDLERYSSNDYLIENYILKKKFPGMIFPATFYRKSLLKELKYYLDAKVGPAEDQYLWFQIGRFGGEIGILKRTLYRYRIHDKQDSFLRGSVMDFLLIDAMCHDSYYLAVFNQNLTGLSSFIKKAISLTCSYYLKKKDKKSIRTNYKKIPGVCKKTLRGKFYSFAFFMVCVFPSFSCFAYRILKKVFKHG